MKQQESGVSNQVGARDGQKRFERVLLKLSGEVLAGNSGFGLDPQAVRHYATEISQAVEFGVQVGLVLGGGNFWRGRMGPGMDRPRADSMGMLATVMNALAMQDALEKLAVPVSVYTAMDIPGVAVRFERSRARRDAQEGKVVIFAGGTGNPYFTTDTAAALRGLEIQAQAVLKATKVDGVYDSDPVKNPQAKRFERLSYQEVLARNLQVMDAAAISLCRDNHLKVLVFDIVTPGNLLKVLAGDNVGTIVEEDA